MDSILFFKSIVERQFRKKNYNWKVFQTYHIGINYLKIVKYNLFIKYNAIKLIDNLIIFFICIYEAEEGEINVRCT